MLMQIHDCVLCAIDDVPCFICVDEMNMDKGLPMPRTSIGHIYIVRLHPETRIKIGFSTAKTENGRFDKVKTFIPELEVIRLWPARDIWESTARRALTNQFGLIPVVTDDAGKEVFDGVTDELLMKMIENGDKYFELMGDPNDDPATDG